MSVSAKKHFDVLEFVKQSKALGVNDQLAEYQARQLENVIDIASVTSREEFNANELATKVDLKTLEVELAKLGAETKQADAKLSVEIKQVEAKLSIEIKQVEAKLSIEIKELEKKLSVELKELETKLSVAIKDVDGKIERYRYDTLKFIVWTGIGVVITLGGLLAKGFHWFS